MHKGRGSWTFPLNPNEPYLQTNVELENDCSARKRLIPKVHLADREKGAVVRINHARHELLSELASKWRRFILISFLFLMCFS